MAIKNIILDLGGVLLDVDYNLTSKAFEKLGYEKFTDMYSQYSADRLFQKLETGKISDDDFYRALNNIRNSSPGHLRDAWNAMLLDFRMESFRFLEKLSSDYRLFLLSNTNAIHKAAFDNIFMELNNRSMDDYFEKAWYSHLIGLRKPDAEIFEFVLRDAKLNAGETLFIDDSYNNTDSAEKTGIITHLLKENETIEEVIPTYLTSSYSI